MYKYIRIQVSIDCGIVSYTFIRFLTVHHDPRYFFPDPDGFHPERWLSKSPITDQSAWIPFSYGTYISYVSTYRFVLSCLTGPANCVGRQLALLELRTVTCALLKKYNFRLARDFRPAKWEENIRDHFILAKGDLWVQIESRG